MLVKLPTFSPRGALTYVDRYVDGDGPAGGGESVAISPDGKHAYYCADTSNTVVYFSRNSSTGALSYLGEIDTSTPIPKKIVFSADGKNAYIISGGTCKITWHRRE